VRILAGRRCGKQRALPAAQPTSKVAAVEIGPGTRVLVVEAVEKDQRELFYPPLVRMLRVVNGISPRLGDLMLRQIRGRSVAPR
jgi:hypothetical protein